MIRRREDDGPRRNRYRSVWSHQPTYPLYGIILAALLMFDGVQLFDQLQHYTYPRASAIRPPMTSHKKNSSHTNGGLSPNGGYRASDDCKTHECATLTSERLPMMDLSADPCDDFYRYACGKFVNDPETGDGSNTATAFTKVHVALETQLLGTVSEGIYPDDLLSFRVVKKLYNLCMNTAKIDAQGFKPLLDNLNKFGGWPVLTGGKWTKEEKSRSWTKAMVTLRTLGYSFDYFFDVSVGVDWKNPSRRIIYLDQPSLGISREDLVEGENNTNVKAYFESMVNLTVSLGAKEERARSELQEALDFEMVLAQFTLPNENRRNATDMYNAMSLEKFQSNYSYTDWVTFFNALFNHTSIEIDKDEIIVIRAPNFMNQLFPLLETTSKRLIGNYVMWRVLKSSSSFLPKTLLQGQKLPRSTEQEQRHRAKECVDIITERLPIAVGALYARIYFDEEPRREALDMVNETRHAFMDILNSVDWMDATTRTAALKRMKSMTFQVGYPVEVMDDTKIDEYYKGLESIELENSYLNTVLYIDRFLTTKYFKKLREAVNVMDWTTHSSPTGVYPHYSFFENSIHIPAHYFQPPFYSFYWPNYMNYGAIGAVIGRAITHGFDDLGRHFDTIDSPADWCQTSAGKAFLGQAFCIMKQDKFSGYNTITDKIADTGGIKVAYKAYKNWAAQYGPDPVLAGLGQKPEHLFWVAAAQTWCSRYGPKPARMRISPGATAPDRFRVLEPMRNLAEFSEDFECPPGSPMNPAKKCRIW